MKIDMDNLYVYELSRGSPQGYVYNIWLVCLCNGVFEGALTQGWMNNLVLLITLTYRLVKWVTDDIIVVYNSGTQYCIVSQTSTSLREKSTMKDAPIHDSSRDSEYFFVQSETYRKEFINKRDASSTKEECSRFV